MTLTGVLGVLALVLIVYLINEYVFPFVTALVGYLTPAWLLYGIFGGWVGYTIGSSLGSPVVVCSIGVILGIAARIIEQKNGQK